MTRWRSAKRPPEDGVLVLVSTAVGLTVGHHDSYTREWLTHALGHTYTVSHWQPLPAPPRVRKEGKR